MRRNDRPFHRPRVPVRLCPARLPSLSPKRARSCSRPCPRLRMGVRSVRQSLGRVLFNDVVAPFDVPALGVGNGWLRREDRRSVARGRDTAVAPRLPAMPSPVWSGAGQAVRVMTGAVLPNGADTVVVQEYVRRRRAHSGGTGCRARRTACRRRSWRAATRAARRAPRARRDRSSGLARHRRSDRPPPAAQRFLDWRRNCIDQPAAPPRRSL